MDDGRTRQGRLNRSSCAGRATIGQVDGRNCRADRGVVDGSGLGQEVVPGDYAIAYHLLKAWAMDGFTFETDREHTYVHMASASHMLLGWAAAGAAFAATALILRKWSEIRRHT